MLSHGRRLYLHPRIAGQTTSGRLALLLQRIVVEPSPVRGLAADYPLSPAFRLAPCAICALFSAFATVTLESVSFLCCGAHSFRDFQQFSLFPCGRFPTRCTAITCPWRALLPLRLRAGVVVSISFQEVNDTPHAQGNHENLQSFDRGSKKFHSVTWNRKLYGNWGFYSTTSAKSGQ